MNGQYSIRSGKVKRVDDPKHQGCVQVQFDWMKGKNDHYWAPVVSPMAGNGRGAFFMPEVGDEVIVAFEQDNIESPLVIGFCWNGRDKPPTRSVRERILRSTNGHCIRFLDATEVDGSRGALVIEDAHGNMIVMSNRQIVIKSVCDLIFEGANIIFRGPTAPNASPPWQRTVVPGYPPTI